MTCCPYTGCFPTGSLRLLFCEIGSNMWEGWGGFGLKIRRKPLVKCLSQNIGFLKRKFLLLAKVSGLDLNPLAGFWSKHLSVLSTDLAHMWEEEPADWWYLSCSLPRGPLGEGMSYSFPRTIQSLFSPGATLEGREWEVNSWKGPKWGGHGGWETARSCPGKG